MHVAALNLAQTTLADVWPDWVVRLETANNQLLQELESCWCEAQRLLESQLQQLETLDQPPLTQSGLAAFQAARAATAQRLLDEPVAQWERRRPYQRALLVLEVYEHSLQELGRTLPESVSVNGPQTLAALQGLVPVGWARRVAKRRRKEQVLPLARLVADELAQLTGQRATTEGPFLLVLAQSIQQLRRNWEAARAALDATAAGESHVAEQVAARRLQIKRCAELHKQATVALSAWRAWLQQMPHALAKRLLGNVAWHRQFKPAKGDQQRAACVSHWAEQARAVEAEVRFELALEASEERILTLASGALESLGQEYVAMRAELNGFITWLRLRLEGKAQELVPQPQADVVPASSRLAEFTTEFQQIVETLPQPILIHTKFSGLPRRFAQSKELQPRETFSEAFVQSGHPKLIALFREIEAAHHRLVREIERAREVVSFGLGEGSATQELDPQITREALQNALSLLEYNHSETHDWQPAADARFAQTLAAVFNENRALLRRNRLGTFAYVGQQGVRRAGVVLSRHAFVATRRFFRRVFKASERLSEDALVYIGWKAEPRAGVSEVVTRPLLPQEFTVDLSVKDLPAIYRRLFRFEPVRDPRFLVGRETEMAALAQARALWEAGRPVSALIVGERGSGKTSLINCALLRPLAGLDVVRGEFTERLASVEQLRASLAQLLGLADVSQLESSLAAERRVIILEELERTFLRQIGYYAPLRELQRLIAASYATTLWVVVTNQIAFRFLDAAVGLGQSFSHRLNAASASRNALREAILLRHNLSGLRLEFLRPPAERALVQRLRDQLRGRAEPERLFFDKLAQESAGVFRTAFEIWLGQIEAARGGALYLKPLVTPDLTPVIDNLDQDDLFTLVAVLQHGSLTPAEHAIIFQQSTAASRAQLDELLAREILDPDPNRSGLRVRPEALRVVQEALYRRNLL